MPWVKGQSGNAKGRPKGSNDFARMVRVQTRNGAELLEFALGVLRGEVKEKHVKTTISASGEPVTTTVETPTPLSERMAAKRWLGDRGWGKAVEHIEIVDETETQPASIATEALEEGLGPEGTIQ